VDVELRLWVQNLAEHKRAEEGEGQYRSLFERVPLSLYRTTPAGQIM
jgi:hypothetical protein